MLFIMITHHQTVPIGAGVHYFSLKSGVSYQGFNRWGIVYDVSPNTATNQFYHIVPASGSGPIK